VIFYNDKGKEIEVKFSAIQDLMQICTRLGNDIIDFVMSRLYFHSPSRMRTEIQFVLSRVSSCYTTVLQGSTTLERWASVFLQPAKGVQVHDVRELLLPWVAYDHWSLLVFHYDKVLHFDSYDGQCHFPSGRHSKFVPMVSHAWQTLRGVQVKDVHVVHQEVAQQPGKYECGHHTIMNTLIYLKVTPPRYG
jgi:Ulp1 family protease